MSATPVAVDDDEAADAGGFFNGNPAVGEFWRANWARAAILGCAAVYGTNFAAVKTLDSEMAPSLSASLRFGLAAVAALPIAYEGVRSNLTPNTRTLAVGALEIGAVNALGYVAQSIGLESVDASLSAFVCSLAVVVVPILDAVVLKKKTATTTWIGAGTAAVGVALLSLAGGSGGGGPEIGAGPTAGLLFTLAQPLCFGYGFWRTENLLRAVADEASGMTAAADCETEAECAEAGFDLTKASLTCGALQLVAVKVTSDLWLLGDVVTGAGAAGAVPLPTTPEELFAQVLTGSVLAAVLWTGLVATFATVLVETLALSKLSARESTVLFSTEPLWGAAFAALLLGEHLDGSAAVGGALVVAACLFSSGVAPPAMLAGRVEEALAVAEAEFPDAVDLLNLADAVDVEAVTDLL